MPHIILPLTRRLRPKMDTLRAELLAKNLMRQHNLDGWNFEWSRAKRVFGCCHYYKKTITLSFPLVHLNSEDHVRDTILHEIAHVIAGHSAGHGYEWKRVARSLGIKPERCAPADTISAPAKWNKVCPNCNKKSPAHRRTNKAQACGKCCRELNQNRYTTLFLLRWELA